MRPALSLLRLNSVRTDRIPSIRRATCLDQIVKDFVTISV